MKNTTESQKKKLKMFMNIENRLAKHELERQSKKGRRLNDVVVEDHFYFEESCKLWGSYYERSEPSRIRTTRLRRCPPYEWPDPALPLRAVVNAACLASKR